MLLAAFGGPLGRFSSCSGFGKNRASDGLLCGPLQRHLLAAAGHMTPLLEERSKLFRIASFATLYIRHGKFAGTKKIFYPPPDKFQFLQILTPYPLEFRWAIIFFICPNHRSIIMYSPYKPSFAGRKILSGGGVETKPNCTFSQTMTPRSENEPDANLIIRNGKIISRNVAQANR